MAGLPWFKLAGDFFSHPKTLELQAELGDPCADVYVVRMWAYVSRVAASGRLTGRNVVTVLERAMGWQGEPGRLVSALLAVGFLEQEPDALVVHDWAREQGAHVAKVERDRNRPRADRRVSHLSPVPARELSGNVAESREGPEVERESEIENTASQATASAAPPPGDDLPDATDDAQPMPEREPLVLEAQEGPQSARGATKKPASAPQPGLVLYERLEANRAVLCEEAGVPFVPSRWAFSRQNKELGPIARLPDGHEDKARLEAAWGAYAEDPLALTREPAFSLDWFWKCRSRYEGRGLRLVAGES